MTYRLILLALFATALDLAACSVPVFRYALERWAPDPYQLVVYRTAELTPEEKAVVDQLRKLEDLEMTGPALIVHELDVTGEIPEELQAIWAGQKEKITEFPKMQLYYPPIYRIIEPVWTGGVTEENRKLLIESEARRELARHLVKGESAVWLFMPGGDEKADAERLAELKKTLADAEKELKLPHELDPNDSEYDMGMSEEIELKIAFSVIEIDRKTEEKLLVDILRPFDEKLFKHDKPVAVPVFGQGRALVAYIGDEITKENILDAATFLTGACSCQVKAQNPGLDLFVPIDWGSFITGMIGVDEGLPPLSVPTVAAPVEQTKPAPSVDTVVLEEAESESALTGGIVKLLIVFAVFVVIGSVVAVIKNRKREQS